MVIGFALVLFAFGLVWGSFVNALVWRLHKQAELTEVQEAKLNSQKSKKKQSKSLSIESAATYSIMRGRSMCPHCHHQLAAKDLVPVFSWLQLKGKCRYCRAPISWQYPFIELLTGVLFVVFYLGWQNNFGGLHLILFLYGLTYIVFFVALAAYDAKWFLLPDRLVFPLTVFALTQVVVTSVWLHSWQALWQPFAGAGVIFGLFWVIYQVSKGEWIGGGDVKLAVPLGLIAGTPLKALLVLFLASLIGTVVSLPSLVRAGKEDGWTRHVPFGPYLLTGCFLVMLFADRFIHWYERIFL